MPTQTIYLARHATPDWTRTDIPYHIPPGPPLTEQGRAEAAALGEFLRQAGVVQVFASPLERCHDTARLAASIAGIPVETACGLSEWAPGETGPVVLERMRPVFETACRLSERGGPVALVTHGGPVGFLLQELGMPAEVVKQHCVYDHRNPLPPAGAWLASREGEGQPWQLSLVFVPALAPATS